MVVPSFEKSVQAMFTQVSTAFDQGMEQRLTKPFNKVVEQIQGITTQMQGPGSAADKQTTSAVESLSVLHDDMRGLVQKLAALERLLPKQQTQTLATSTKALKETLVASHMEQREAMQNELGTASEQLKTVSEQLRTVHAQMRECVNGLGKTASLFADQQRQQSSAELTDDPISQESESPQAPAHIPAQALQPQTGGVEQLVGPVIHALQRGEYDTAFNLALRMGSTEVDRWLLGQFPSADHRTALLQGRYLSQPVLLSLIQHLSMDLLDEYDTKVAWLREAMQVLDHSDASISRLVDTVLRSVTEAVSHAQQEQQRSPPASTGPQLLAMLQQQHQAPEVVGQLSSSPIISSVQQTVAAPAAPAPAAARAHSDSQNAFNNILGMLRTPQ